MNEKSTILIVDDSEFNRSFLREILQDDYMILEACDGLQAISIIQEKLENISLVLLDTVMPKMDGFEVLKFLTKNKYINDIPVIIISSELTPSIMEKTFEYGAIDFISRPFDLKIVKKRVKNAILLYSKQKKLVNLVTNQMLEREKNNALMVNILSQIVEFRNGESGAHVLHINALTEILLNNLVKHNNTYDLSSEDIESIVLASSLHDIGKIAIPEEILNKPGRLTPTEFEVIKTHSIIGANMIASLKQYKDEILIKYAYEICRWHHEKYDGNGYPDGLVGDKIPISAQIVSIADVFDALTSERCYKKAYSTETSLNMIINGECGKFNPILIECLLESKEEIVAALKEESDKSIQNKSFSNKLMNYDELQSNDRNLNLLDLERKKIQYFAELTDEVIFEYMSDNDILTINDFGKVKTCFNEIYIKPKTNEDLINYLGEGQFNKIVDKINLASPSKQGFKLIINLKDSNYTNKDYELYLKTIWDSDQLVGYIGKLIEIEEF